MQLAKQSSSRSPTGILATIAVHAGLGWLALAGLGIVDSPIAPPSPIVTRNIPDPVPPPQKIVTPRTVEQQIAIKVDRPEFVIVQPPVADTSTTTITGSSGGTTIIDAGPDPVIVADPPTKTGITRRAALDVRFMRDFEAPYPPASQRLGETGTVLVRVVIGPDGRVLSASVARSSGFARLDDAAIKRALAKWRFVPALDDGVAIEATRDVPVTFRLQG